MREKIILAPGLNGNELVLSLALHHIPTMNVRIVNGAELARLALMRSGIAATENYAGEKDALLAAAAAASGEPYFGKVTFSDALEIAHSITQMRSLVDKDEETGIRNALEKGSFPKKNQALLKVYLNYMEDLQNTNAIDGIALMRRAIAQATPLSAECISLKEYPLNPLEHALLEKVSSGNSTELSLMDLFQVQEKETSIHINSYRNCYGAPNEVETIISDIYENAKTDQCTVAVSDPATYSQLFFDYAVQYDIPVTFGCGVSIINSNPAKLLSRYLYWMTDGFYGKDALRELIMDPSFDRWKLLNEAENETPSIEDVIRLAGQIRLTRDGSRNMQNYQTLHCAISEDAKSCKNEKEEKIVQRNLNALPCVKALAEALSEDSEAFIQKYAYLRKPGKTLLLSGLDASALNDIYESMQIMRRSVLKQTEEDMIRTALRHTVMKQASAAGAIYVTDVANAAAVMRDNLFVCGMSALRFPGSPKENHLLLDEDLKQFPDGGERYSSDGKILNKRRQLFDLMTLAGALHVRTSISYAGMNVSELKTENPSSVLFELFQMEHGSTSTAEQLDREMQKIGYFDPPISATRKIGEKYIREGFLKNTEATEPQSIPVPHDLERAYSPSAFELFFGCPRRFQLRYLLNIPEPEENDPLEVIPAKDFGILVHSMMEELSNSGMGKDAFLTTCGEAFDRYIMEHPPVVQSYVSSEKEAFLETMDNAYEMDPKQEVILKEEDIQEIHESGVKIHGIPDRVERTENGHFRVVDYKTGRQIRHNQDDVDTCLQVLIYAYMMEKQGYPIDGCEYRYLRLRETVACKYDDSMKEALDQKLRQFKTAMENGDFPTAAPEDQKEVCRYCKFSSVCGRKTEVEEETDE